MQQTAAMKTAPLAVAPLEDPLYYLHNARALIHWCLERYGTLLQPDEIHSLERLLALEEPAQALLIRMVMRKGSLFRHDGLNYAEVPDRNAAIAQLAANGLVNPRPELSVTTLAALCRRQECQQLARQLLPQRSLDTHHRKGELVTLLGQHFADDQQRPLAVWWPQAPFRLLALSCTPLFERLRLMFFGNLQQDWSTFVLTELGLQQYESVPFTAASRPFQTRTEVDLYLQLQQLRERLDAGDALEPLCQALPSAVEECLWLEERRHRLLFRLGREAERQQQIEQALDLYTQSRQPEAQLRQLRMLEKREPPARLLQQVEAALGQIDQPEIRLGLQRIRQRCARRAGLTLTLPPDQPIPTRQLRLPRPAAAGVEQAVIDHLSAGDSRLYHVENSLFNALFGLLFWPALYAPVRGAFFNPFQAAPADLYRPGFATARAKRIEQGFAQLRSGRYRPLLRQRLIEKWGISCPLIQWSRLSPELLETALELIPAAHLEVIFRHLLLDLRHHRRGMPDLIALQPQAGQYQLIEVKGPGDRLQDHQRLWLQKMLQHRLPVSVLRVAWLEETPGG